MKILNAKQLQQADAATIAREPIASIELMERASKRWLATALPFISAQKVVVFAGFGNNGGDGLAIARLLAQMEYEVSVCLANFGHTLSADCETNRKKLPQEVALQLLDSGDDIDAACTLAENALLVDALFGSGLNRALDNEFADLVKKINALSQTVLSVDIPSGLYADRANSADDVVICATHTFSFQCPKLSFMMSENAKYCGAVQVVDINLNESFMQACETPYHLGTFSEIKPLLKRRESTAHKGLFGHVGVVCGTETTAGAALLAAQAAFHTGAGWVSLIGNENLGITASAPHLMLGNFNDARWHKRTYCAGPGLGTEQSASEKLKVLLADLQKPMVLDADALNLLAEQNELLNQIPKHSILTPHLGELQRLIGNFGNGFERLEAAVAFAQQHEIVLVVKGPHTAVINFDGTVYFNSTGNAGLAKAGSGDVLSGVITSFLAQGMAPFDAASAAVFVHGLAADMALANTSDYSIGPQMLHDYLGKAIKFVQDY